MQHNSKSFFLSLLLTPALLVISEIFVSTVFPLIGLVDFRVSFVTVIVLYLAFYYNNILIFLLLTMFYRSKNIMKRITLKEYIEFIGQKNAAVIFDCSEAACKAWRYGYRQPTINQAKKIIIATKGSLNYDSIYGPVTEHR